MRTLILTLLLVANTAVCAVENSKLVFDLFPQTRPYIYSVAIDDGKRWYQLEWKVLEGGESKTKTCNVFYDSISKNFYCTIGNIINMVPINQPYEIRIKKE